MGSSQRFAAFISYSHKDEAWARWLHRRLESFRVPRHLAGTQGSNGKVPKQIGRCFRDQTELAVAGELSTALQDALRQSHSLIAVCSPEAAASPWVNEEIRFFRSLGRGDRIYALIVAGEPHSKNPARECFPAALLQDLADKGFIEL